MRSTLFIVVVVLLSSLSVSAQVYHWERSAALPVTQSAGLQKNPLIVPDAAGGAIIVWEDRNAGQTRIVAQRIASSGALLWDTAAIVLATGYGARTLGRLLADGGGGAYVLWWDKRNGSDYDVFLQHIRPDGRLVLAANGTTVSDAGGDQLLADAVLDGSSGLFICWEDHRNASESDIYAQYLTASGQALWQVNGKGIATAIGDQLAPHIVSCIDNSAVVVWLDKRQDEDVYAQRVASDGSALWQPNGQPVATGAAKQYHARALSMRYGRTLLVWEDLRNGTTSDLYYQVLAPTGAEQHAINGLALARGAQNQTDIALTEDLFGGAIVAWTDFRSGGVACDIYARRIDSLGVAQWRSSGADAENGLLVCNEIDEQRLPALAPDGLGGAFFVWQDNRSAGDIDLYMQSFYADGSARWPANGAPLLVADHNQISPHVARTDSRSVIITWSDGRIADEQADIYAQRISFSPFQPDTVAFDSLLVGSERSLRVLLRNTTNDAINVSALSLSGGQVTDYAITDQPLAPFALLAGDTLGITVRFIPRDKGYRYTNMSLEYSAAGSAHLLRLGGVGVSPALSSFPSRIDFGTRKVGVPVDTLLGGYFKNTGFGTLTVHSMAFDGQNPEAFSLIGAPRLPFLVPSGDSIPLQLRFTPSASVLQSCYLTTISNGLTSTRTLCLTGTGAYPAGVLSPISLQFDSSSGAPASKPVYLRNTGTVPLQILGADVQGSHRRDFEALFTSPVTIPPGDSITVFFRFTPQNNGVRNAYGRIITDLYSPLLLLRLSGIGYDIETHIEAPPPATPPLHPGFTTALVPLPATRGSGACLLLRRTEETATATHITARIYDVRGVLRISAQCDIPASGALTVPLPVASLPAGVYFVALESDAATGPSPAPLRLLMLP